VSRATIGDRKQRRADKVSPVVPGSGRNARERRAVTSGTGTGLARRRIRGADSAGNLFAGDLVEQGSHPSFEDAFIKRLQETQAHHSKSCGLRGLAISKVIVTLLLNADFAVSNSRGPAPGGSTPGP
jgi:hypothetical protein